MRKEAIGDKEETLDDLILGNMYLWQSRKGYRFSIDAVLLAFFAHLKPEERVIDLGTGSGVIPLLLAWREHTAQIVGIDILPQVVERARRNVILNRLSEKIHIELADIKTIPQLWPAQLFQVVVANPPFAKAGSGKISQDEEQAIARHEIKVSLPEVIKAAEHLLAPGGRFYIIYRPERREELCHLLTQHQLYPQRIREVHPYTGQSAKMILLAAEKKGKDEMIELPPLIMYTQPGEYSPEIQGIYDGKRSN